MVISSAWTSPFISFLHLIVSLLVNQPCPQRTRTPSASPCFYRRLEHVRASKSSVNPGDTLRDSAPVPQLEARRFRLDTRYMRRLEDQPRLAASPVKFVIMRYSAKESPFFNCMMTWVLPFGHSNHYTNGDCQFFGLSGSYC
ncbi:uncharacterized protein EDB93DRAFT_895513 [Suillus bovinus]|uniref:uncharacterized protein n=1 Tax=Suillus bovinus TaxID=48563 RepID=UPI001B873CDD|nr:uncharacterized protein EDB93DRAFT_895513 [Suillus bovinus]KAG2132875.1 hypothetical protein EDB93DRAFT_895513 [Suillus bovinus]